MTDGGSFNWTNLWLGALLAGGLATAFFIGTNAANLPVLAGGGILIAVLAASAWWAYRRNQRELAIGLISGYAILSLVSAGQCTLLLEESGDSLSAVTGLVLYSGLLAAGLIAIWVVQFVRKRRQRRGESS